MKKPNYFITSNQLEVKYLTQQEISEGWIQKLPNFSKKKPINHFNVTLAYLPPHLWNKLKKINKNGEETFKTIVDGISIYNITETNQDDSMFLLYYEITKINPNIDILNNLIEKLDNSLYSSWLVLRSKYYINNLHFPPSEPVNLLEISSNYFNLF
jgi:hypothetical protein